MSVGMPNPEPIGPFGLGQAHQGDCRELIPLLPDESVDIVVTSPPYWGLRQSDAQAGTEEDPRGYLRFLTGVFSLILPKMKPEGIAWVNIADTYNTPVNWTPGASHRFSTLGHRRDGLAEANSAHAKPRAARKAFVDDDTPWLTYGNLMALPYRLITGLCDNGWLFRGEVMWHKLNPMPEGRCRRPHRSHEPIYLLAKTEKHQFRVSPPVKTVWQFPNERVEGLPHHSRFPEKLPALCVEAYGSSGDGVVVLDPFSGSGTTGVAAARAGCAFVGFEIDAAQTEASNARIREAAASPDLLS